MVDIINKEDCCGCNACGDICPKQAIKFVDDNEGFWYPLIDRGRCINCNLCENVCPVIHAREVRIDNYSKPLCYSAQHKNMQVVFASTTGGLFSSLAEVMYVRGGYVGGAIHNADYSVSEFISNKQSDLKYLRMSKDLQSDSVGFYKKVGELLKLGENILVCALPCQISALKMYLQCRKIDSEKLITVDLICLGVNSPKVWRKYLDYIEDLNGSKIIWTENKSKEYGWHNLTQKFQFENGKVYFDTVGTSLYNRGFLYSHLYCRPSCYNCRFKEFPRVGDISIGDFWGIERYDKTNNSDIGTSLVLINSNKGKEYFEEVKHSLNYNKVPAEWAVSGNPAIEKSISKIVNCRDEFFNDLDILPFDKVIEKYKPRKTSQIKILLRKIKSQLQFIRKIFEVTKLHPKAIFWSIKYSGINNLVHHKGIIFGRNSNIYIHKKCNLNFNGLLIFGISQSGHNSKHEAKLFLGENSCFQVLGDYQIGNGCNIEVYSGANLTIYGKKHVICDAKEDLTIICENKIEIGADTYIGRGVQIMDTNGNRYTNIEGYQNTSAVIINEKVWLSDSCTIRPGVIIGKGAIVGASATVFDDVPECALVIGNPATVSKVDVLFK